jgi:hypothetical protein
MALQYNVYYIGFINVHICFPLWSILTSCLPNARGVIDNIIPIGTFVKYVYDVYVYETGGWEESLSKKNNKQRSRIVRLVVAG